MHRNIILRICLGLAAAALTTSANDAVAQGRGGRGGGGGEMINRSMDPMLSPFRWRSIGPANPGGRIDDIEAAPSDPNIIYIGYAVGGVFKSTNNGIAWEPVFDTYSTASIGDIAVHPTNPDIVYVGTGEPNNRQSSSFGDGIYKTTDGGRTFTHIGLRETQTIARIIIDPRNPETIYVAALGHLFGPNPDRGVFKSTNGGQTWTKVKFIDDNTGFTDITFDPSNSSTIYAASYQRRRTAWGFNGGGPGSGIWKSTDAGATWTRMSGGGLPNATLGRIALATTAANPNVVYAQIEVGASTAPTEETTPGAAAAAAQPPGRAGAAGRGTAGAVGGTAGAAGGAAGAAGGGGARGGGGGRGGTGADPTVDRCNVTSTVNAANLPAVNAGRSGVYRSEDKGQTWRTMSNCNGRPMYFSQIRADPTNDQIVFIAELPVKRSMNGGATFTTLSGFGHVDQHAIWIDPKDGKRILLGNDGGFNISYDRGDTWDYINTMAASLFYQVSVDMSHPYNVCGGLQDNNTWCGPSSIRGGGPTNAEWFSLCGGDGFYTAIDPTDSNIIYCESQQGGMSRYDLRTGRSGSIKPNAGGGGGGGRGSGVGAAPAGGRGAAPPGAAAPASQTGMFGNIIGGLTAPEGFRWNWNTPFMLSPHDPRTVIAGGNRFFVSRDRGQTWFAASPDLTRRIDRSTRPIMDVPGTAAMLSKNDGVQSYGNIATVGESPIMPGVYWAGTDDGNVQMSRDGGATWTNVVSRITGAPAECYVSRVEPSHFNVGGAYVSFDCHRNNDHKPYIFATSDYGQTWRSIIGGLPAVGNVNVVKEDFRNPNLLFAGTDYSFFVSLDGGTSWKKFMNNLPTVRIDDVVIHPRESDLVLATHGRSVWIMDDITALQQLTPQVQSQDFHLFDMRPSVAWAPDITTSSRGRLPLFRGESAPRGVAISYYLRSVPSGEITISVRDPQGNHVFQTSGTRTQGLNRVQWGLTSNAPMSAAPDTTAAGGGRGAGAGGGGGGGGGRGGGGGAGVEPGTYIVTLSVGGRVMSKPVIVLEDRWVGEGRGIEQSNNRTIEQSNNRIIE